MKFNWRANWEILLVLVIIVVGIVITTIAAIRNKDKHLLTLPEETDYGQLLATGAVGSLSETGIQQDQHQHRLHQQTTDQPSQGTSPAAELPQQQVPQASSKALSRHTTQNPFRPITRDTSGTTRNHRDFHQTSQNHHESRQRPQLTRYDDNAEFNRAPVQVSSLGDEQHMSNGLSRLNQFGDHYEPASTEPSPAQVRSESPGINGPFLPVTNGSQQVSQGFVAGGYQSAGSRRHMNRTQFNENETHLNYGDLLSDQADLVDDIHTTRSSLASDSPGSSQQKKSSQQADLSSTLSMQAPYGSVSASSMNQLGQLLMQSMNGNNKVDPESTILNPEDVLFGRVPPNANLTEALLNDYGMTGLGTTNLTANQQQLLSPAMLANLLGSLSAPTDLSTSTDPFGPQGSAQMPPPPASTPAPGSHRAFSSLSPISLIINDLLKMARPHHNSEYANGRLQNGGGILAHSRLPGSLLNLLQGSPQGPSNGAHHTGEAQGFHDASESSQHYQRVSMSPTDIQSILAHSLLSSNVLPAYPPPKGSHASWVPPTSGGSSDYNLAQNSNADFVINNVAGFLRSSQQDSAISPTQNDQPSYQRQQIANHQQLGSFFAPADGAQAQQLVVQQQQQQQQQQQLNQQQLDQAKVDQQQHLAPIGTNQASGSVPSLWTQTSPTGRQVSGSGGDLERKVFRSTLASQGGSPQVLQQQTVYQSQVHPSSQQRPAAFGSNMNAINSQQYQAPGSSLHSTVPVYKSRIVSEIPVPLGYTPPQQQQVAAPNAASHVEPNPRQAVVAGSHKQQTQLINKVGTVAPSRPAQQSPAPKSRRKRAASNKGLEEKERVDEVMSSRYGAGDEEDDDTDSRPISVVRPDGRPMNSGRVRGFSIAGKTMNSMPGVDDEPAASDRQVAQSQRSANHLGMKRPSRPSGEYQPAARTRANQRRDEEQRDVESGNQRDHLADEPSANSIRQKCKPSGARNRGGNQLEAAGSGLMSKLLGTASTNDELEEELDDDEDPSSEKRKEEIEDAEFGLVNDDRQRGAPEPNSEGPSNQVDGKLRADSDSGLGSGSTDNESYMRRNQQRSDIEFYGHPGEETRQLKYGILGSGNYEVVNGGIYPEADESTAAVNSIANYVRKPGQGGLLSALPKLLGAGAGDPASPQLTYMPGGRVGGFMRGASEHSSGDGELVGLVPAEEAAAKDGLSSPLLELIEANGGQLFDPSLLAQLGSSGSSARSTHTSQDQSTGGRKQQVKAKDSASPQERPSSSKSSRGQTKFRNSLEEELAKTYDGQDFSTSQRQSRREKLESNEIKSHPSLDRQQSSISGSRSSGANQFNSYQLLPSKKVTIFSDQDLDSAPSELRPLRQRPPRKYPFRSHP